MPREWLGEVICPSGSLLVVDIGLLGMWSHTGAPLLDERAASPETLAIANAAVDFRVEGKDALAANALFGQGSGWLYDRSPGFVEAFQAEVAERGLDARLVASPARISHRQRVEYALVGSGRAGIVEFHGIGAACVGALPAGTAMGVYGTRVGASDFSNCWQFVEIDVRQGTRATIQPIGEVLVDCARLGFVDVEMLAEWEHDEAIDGRADFLLWGLDAAEIAQIQDIPSVGEEQFGWVNLPVEEVVERGLAIEALREAGGHRFATDFRPHSHHYRLMEEIRSSPTESGTFALGDAKLCAFMTTWGDGVFPVEVDRDAEGNVLTIRVVLRAAAGSPKIQ